MITKITKKEFDSIKRLRDRHFSANLTFTHDGKYYKCSTPAGAGLAEIMRFRKAQKRIKESQLDLLGFPTMLQ